MVSENTLNVSDWDFIRSLAENEATSVANNSYGLPPKSSKYLPLKSLRGSVRNHRKAYETELSRQLKWRYEELRRGNVLTYDLGKKQKVISLSR